MKKVVNQKLWVIMVAVVVVVVLIIVRGFWPHESMPQRMAKELKLTAQQQVQLKAQREQQMKVERQKFGYIRQLHERLDDEYLKTNPDETVITLTIREIKATQQELMDLHFAGLAQMRQILTKEQLAKMIQSRRAVHGKTQQRWKQRRFGPPMLP